MRIKLSLLFAILSFSWATAQDTLTGDVKSFGLMKAGATQKALYLGDSSEQALKILGKPTQTETHYSEVDDAMMEVWTYHQSKLYFLKNALKDFTISDTHLWVGKARGETFKIGDKLLMHRNGNTKTALFYHYPVTIEKGRSRNIDYTESCAVTFTINGHWCENFIELLFKNGVLINVGTFTPA